MVGSTARSTAARARRAALAPVGGRVFDGVGTMSWGGGSNQRWNRS